MLALPERGIARSVEAHNVELDVLADWIEASVLFQEEPEISGAELVDLLCETQIYEQQAFAWERMGDAWAELRRRQDCLGGFSPLTIEPHRITRLTPWRDTPAHSFCVVLSLAKWYPKWASRFGHNYTEQGELFELVTRASLERLLPGWRFHLTGWARTRTNKLGAVVKDIAALLGESIGKIERWTKPTANEAGLDLLCYRPFVDARVGVPVYLLQCASGADWESKLHTPRLEIWRRLVEFAATPRKAFSTPFAFLDTDFVRNCVLVDGLLIDRYRLLSAGRDNLNWITAELRARLVAWLEPRVTQLPRAQEVV